MQGSACVAQKITETTKSLKTCSTFNTYCAHFRIVRRLTEVQQRVNRSGSRVIERAVVESHQRLAFMLE